MELACKDIIQIILQLQLLLLTGCHFPEATRTEPNWYNWENSDCFKNIPPKSYINLFRLQLSDSTGDYSSREYHNPQVIRINFPARN